MRARAFLSVLSVVVLSVFILVSGAQANLEAVYAVDNLFAAVSAGELDVASSLFSADAVATFAVTSRSYEGSEEIDAFLEVMHGEERKYEIVQLTMVGNSVELTVDIADRGHVWGRQRLSVDVQGGMIQRLEVVETRLTLWRIQG